MKRSMTGSLLWKVCSAERSALYRNVKQYGAQDRFLLCFILLLQFVSQIAYKLLCWLICSLFGVLIHYFLYCIDNILISGTAAEISRHMLTDGIS